MLTRRDLLRSAATVALVAPWMKGSSALAQTSDRPASGLKTDNVDDQQNFNHHFATVNGIRMHYVEEGQGPLVILLHGYPFLWYLWRHQIKALAAAGYRVVAPDQRGYGQSDCPKGADSYEMTRLVGDVVGLINALDSKSAVLVGQDYGSPVSYNTTLMRPDLVRGVVMMAGPAAARSPIRPSEAWKQIFKDLYFYQSYLATPQATAEIMRDLRRFLLGVFLFNLGILSGREAMAMGRVTTCYKTFVSAQTTGAAPPIQAPNALRHESRLPPFLRQASAKARASV